MALRSRPVRLRSRSGDVSKNGNFSSLFDWEDGKLDLIGELELFGSLIRTGDAWKLQGFYGRHAAGLIQSGLLTEQGQINWEVYDTVAVDQSK